MLENDPDAESRLEKNLKEYTISKGHVPMFTLDANSWANPVPFDSTHYWVPIGHGGWCKIPEKIAEKGTNLTIFAQAIDKATGNT